MKPYLHAKSSAKKWGGDPDEYLPIHDFFDSTKAAHASVKHRAILHSAFGIFLAEQVFGHNITNSNGRLVSVRDIGEQHVIEDLGFIPSVDDYLRHMTLEPWMGGPSRKTRTVDLNEPDEAPADPPEPPTPAGPVTITAPPAPVITPGPTGPITFPPFIDHHKVIVTD